MTGRHQLWQVVRFDNIFNPIYLLLAEYFLSALQIDFWYDESTLTERNRSIRQHFQQPLTVTCEIFFCKCLANWLPVCVSIYWEMVYQISGITRRINRVSTSGKTVQKLPLTNRSGLIGCIRLPSGWGEYNLSWLALRQTEIFVSPRQSEFLQCFEEHWFSWSLFVWDAVAWWLTCRSSTRDRDRP